MVQTQSIYLIEERESGGLISAWRKVGISESPKKRARGLATGNPRELTVAFAQQLQSRDLATRAEYYAITRIEFEGFARRGEWFRIDRDRAVNLIEWAIEEAYNP